MQRTILALAIAALPLAAAADVSLYGSIQGNLGRNTVSNGQPTNRVDDTTSVIGFKGEEALGNGLKALWQIESRVHLADDNSKDTFGTRETFAGLADPALGRLRIGYLNSAVNDLYTINQWEYAGNINQSNEGGDTGTNAGANGLSVLANPGNRVRSAIRYDTPEFAGLSANVGYGFGENRGGSGATRITRSSDLFSFGVTYRKDGYFAGYAFQREANPFGLQRDVSTNKLTATPQTGGNVDAALLHYVEAGYKTDDMLLGFAYQDGRGYDWTDSFSGDSKANFGNNTTLISSAQARVHTRQAALSGAYAFGPWKPKASLAWGLDQEVGGSRIADSGYRQWVIGVDYRLSKRTVAGLSYGRLTFGKNTHAAIEDNATTVSTTALSLSHKF